jgi:hypothetical protein
MDDLIKDNTLDIEDAEVGVEPVESIVETPSPSAKPAIDPEYQRKVEEKEHKRWETASADERIREAALRAWEKERLADMEGRESRLVPLTELDPNEYQIDPTLPRVKPTEKTASRYEPYTDALDDAETELTAVIAECRYFMREMAFESARMTPLPRDRLSFIESARSLAQVSAEVGKSIAPLRNPALIQPEEKKKRARR